MSTLTALLGACAAMTRLRLADLVELTKPRLNLLVLITTAAGFFLGAAGGTAWLNLLHVLLGTLITASGASILNQAWEVTQDGRMDRTRGRPLPAGRMALRDAVSIGWLLVGAGIAYLVCAADWIPGLLSLLTVALYLFCYTPLKRRTPLNTLIGAFPGALPTLIGWSAASPLDASAGSLFAILFLWQMPHFFSIAWLYRRDYAQGGFRMWPVVDGDGRVAGWMGFYYALALGAIAWTPAVLGLSGRVYGWAAGLLSLGFAFTALLFALRRTDRSARRLFLASVVYLGLLMAFLMLEKHALLSRLLGLAGA